MALLTNNRARLRNCHVILKIVDHNELSLGRELGQGVLWLGDSSLWSGDKQTVTIPIAHGGLPAGTITAVLSLKWAEPTFKPLPKDAL
jgi:hypothetical protein